MLQDYFFFPYILEFQFHRFGGLIGTYLSSSLVAFSTPPLYLIYTAEMEVSDNGSTGSLAAFSAWSDVGIGIFDDYG